MVYYVIRNRDFLSANLLILLLPRPKILRYGFVTINLNVQKEIRFYKKKNLMSRERERESETRI